MDGNQKNLTKTSTESGAYFCFDRNRPVLLVAHSPEQGQVSVDRCEVTGTFIVGRDATCDLVVADKRISGAHFRISQRNNIATLTDLNSKNGTFVDGVRVDKSRRIDSGTLIRAGQALFVYHANGADLMKTPLSRNHGMAGSFHTSKLVSTLTEAVISKRNLLITGPTGTGKELAAAAVAEMMGKHLVTFNAARMASKEEATATLFGVTARFFSNVDARQGLIEIANGGVLFIDEIHNLGDDIQRGLLRVMETGEMSRMGEAIPRRVDVRFILASNAEGATHGLAHDLFARLRLVKLSPLSERLADIPDIFTEILEKQLMSHRIDPGPVLPLLRAEYFEALMLEGCSSDNIRGLVNLSDRIATRIASGVPPRRAVMEIFLERFGTGMAVRRNEKEQVRCASRYERNKSVIISTYLACDRNVSRTEAELKRDGLRCSRRWLSVFLDKWGSR